MSGPAIARALLVDSGDLTALVPAARVFSGVVPQNTALPCIGITEVSSTDRLTVPGKRGGRVLVTSLVQVTVMAASYPACKAAMMAARGALRDFVGDIGAFTTITCRLDGQGPDFQNDAGHCAQSQDLRITYIEAP